MKCYDCGHIADEAFFEHERDVDENITVMFYNCPVCNSKEVSFSHNRPNVNKDAEECDTTDS